MAFPENPLQQLIAQRIFATRNRLRGIRFEGRQDLPVKGAPVVEDQIPLAEAKRQRYTAVATGDTFGPKGGGWCTRWFKLELPRATAEEKGRRLLFWECEGETTVWIGSKPWAGIDVGHHYCVLPDSACTLHLEVGTWQTGIWAPGARGIPKDYGCRFTAAYVALRAPGWDAFHDYEALCQLLSVELGKHGYSPQGANGYNEPYHKASPLLRSLLRDLDDACDAYEVDGLDAFARHLKKLYRKYQGGSFRGRASLIGHSHLDLVWLWPEMASKHKALHTSATMLRLMERYPEFRYIATQPAYYDYIRDGSPGLFKEVQAQIKAKRWEATGGMEVEADVTIPAGEALARGMLYGQQRFVELRGSISKVLWIPDVFGYSNCLPQIAKLGGCDYFYTTKMTWSAVTRFPYSSLRWRGADGTELITHLTPCGYNGQVHAAELTDAIQEYQQTDVHDELLTAHGFGDGAGGATEEMLERARRYRDLAGMPQAQWTTAEDFFDRLGAVADRLPVYQGEMYLEYHRATYTTQGQLKQNYRRAERALLAHEAVRVVTGGAALPKEAWLRTLFVHFHDAIPGSSITRVYDELNPELQATAARERDAAADELARTGRNQGLLVLNPVAIDRGFTLEFAAADLGVGALKGVATPDGSVLPVQKVKGGKRARYIARLDAPGLGSLRLQPATALPEADSITASAKLLDNGLVRARFNAKGQLSALRVRGEELELQRAEFRLYPDHPAAYDAWDIDRATMALGQTVLGDLALEVVEQGPVRAVLRASAAISATSTATVSFILEAGSDALRVEVSIDWDEDHKLLKYHLVTGYRGRSARFGAPFGSVERPQLPGYHNDESQWEVAGQRWMTLGHDGGAGGIAVTTEAKYGFSCRDGDIGLSLLRAPKHPDPTADLGHHDIAFAIGRARSHCDGDELSTAAQAEALFTEVVAVTGGAMQPPPLALGDLGSAVPAGLKPAEDGAGFVLRLHETAGDRISVTLSLPSTPKQVSYVDLLERKLGSVAKAGKRGYRIDLAPYQIVSVLVR